MNKSTMSTLHQSMQYDAQQSQTSKDLQSLAGPNLHLVD
jgi:hypothetical protein